MQFEERRSLILSEASKSPGSKSFLGAVEYIERNYEPSDRLAIVLRNRLTGETTQRLASAEKIASPDFQAWLRHKNARGADIYISQNAFRSEARTRSKADVDKIRHIYLDLDKNGEESLTKIRHSSLVPEPSFVIITSPHGYQVIWKVTDMAPSEAEALQKAMVAEFAGDPAATDSTRVLRLPGFQNKKYQRDYPVEAYPGSGQTYSLPDFRIPADDRPSESRPLDETKKKRGRQAAEITQSERDWAYVKEQLNRGEAPERLVEALTHFRQDKSSPDYYARQTVSRAYVSVALARGDTPIEIEQKVAQFATHQPHPATYARQTMSDSQQRHAVGSRKVARALGPRIAIRVEQAISSAAHQGGAWHQSSNPGYICDLFHEEHVEIGVIFVMVYRARTRSACSLERVSNNYGHVLPRSTEQFPSCSCEAWPRLRSQRPLISVVSLSRRATIESKLSGSPSNIPSLSIFV